MNKTEYKEYEESFNTFFDKTTLLNLTPISDPETGDYEPFFSNHPCDCCGVIAGDRVEANGVTSDTREVLEFTVCIACIYYAEYGHLSDSIMNNEEINKYFTDFNKMKLVWSKKIFSFFLKGMNEQSDNEMLDSLHQALKDPEYATKYYRRMLEIEGRHRKEERVKFKTVTAQLDIAVEGLERISIKTTCDFTQDVADLTLVKIKEVGNE